MASVLIADDHAVVRAGFKTFLCASGGIGDVGEVSTGVELLREMQTKPWNLLVLDIHLPDRNGMSMLQEFRRDFPLTKVLVVSGLPEEQYAIEAIRAGAAGYLSKDCAPDELVTAVRRVLGGQRYVSAMIAEKIVAELGKPTTPRHEQLSLRERQVFDRLAAGSTVTAIAQELALSVKTVSTYRTRILEKMSFRHNADVTSYAIRHGLAAPRELAQNLSPGVTDVHASGITDLHDEPPG